MIVPVTCWLRGDPYVWEYEHNHIEDGWSQDSKPQGKFPEQTNNWRGSHWRKSHEYMVTHDGNKIITRQQLLSLFLNGRYN